MAYGIRYTFQKPMNRNNRTEGVKHAPNINKWLVRIKNKKNVISTVASFKSKEQADKYYKSLFK